MKRHVRALVAVAALAVFAGGCTSAAGPDIGELEAQHDVAGLVDAAVDGSDEAVEALRRLGDPEAYTLLAAELNGVQSEYGYLDTGALAALGGLGGPAAVTIIVDWTRASYATLSADGAFPQAEVASALTRIGADAVEPMAVLLDTPLPPEPSLTDPNRSAYETEYALRRIAIATLGGRYVGTDVEPPVSTGPVGSDRAEQVLLNVLRTPYAPGQVDDLQYEAGTAIVSRRRDDPSPLFPLLDDPSTARVSSGLVLLGREGTEPVLVAALQRHAEDSVLASRMATSFVNSGNAALEDAGNAWASAHGYYFTSNCPVPPCEESATWGTIDSVPEAWR